MNVKVLCYHRVNSLEKDINSLAVSCANFKKHMQWIKNNYEILRFEDDWRTIKKDAVVVSFDDGYKDFIENAIPILEDMEIPATVFITTMENQNVKMMWWDELEYLIFHKNLHEFTLNDYEFRYSWKLDTLEDRCDCYNSLHFLIKSAIDVGRRMKWMDQLWDSIGENKCDLQEYKMMDREDISYIDRHPLITIGGHTCSHPDLKNQSLDVRKKEIEDSIKYVNSIVKDKIQVFAFPFGKYPEDYDEYDNKICKENGILKTASTNSGSWNLNDEYYNINRIGVNNKELSDFIQYIEAVC